MRNERCRACSHDRLISYYQNKMDMNLSYSAILFYCFGCKHGPIFNTNSRQMLYDDRQRVIYMCADEVLKQFVKNIYFEEII